MPAAWPQADADRALRAATFRLVTPAGGFAGTGFLVAGEGLLMTCRHVVAEHAGLKAVDREGRVRAARPASLDDEALSAADMALLSLDETDDLPLALPLCLREPGEAFLARVQQADAGAFLEGVPLEGRLRGPTRITYASGGRDYGVEGRAVADLRVQKGMSGSAIWDRDAAAVVGVLAVSAGADANLGGFAIPFVHVQGSARLAALLARNDAQVARYGDRPNALGLGHLLQAASDRALGRLEARGVVRRGAFVEREGFAAALDAFLASGQPALAIVSAAGQGKTSLVAHLARQDPPPPAWLVRAADFGRDESPKAGLNRLLREAGAPQGLAWPQMAAGTPALLLLDGLNEAPIGEDRLAGEWAPDLIAEAAEAGWKVVYTTRRELHALMGPGRGPPFPAFELGRYTSHEAEAASKLYGLGHRGARTLDREPLLLRLSAEVGGGARRSEVLKLFVARLLESARGGRHPEALVDALAAVAARAAARETRVAAYDDPGLADSALAHALCEANLLEIVPAGYRFVFDEVADYLHARHAAGALKAGDGDGLDSLPENVAALSLEILAGMGAADLAAAAAEDLAARIGGDIGDGRRAFGVIAALPLAAEFADAKARAAQNAAGDWFIQRLALARPGLLSAFALESVQQLAREAVLDQNGYGWREKDVWSDIHRGATVGYARMDHGIFRLIHDLLDDAEVDGAGLLIGWLSDNTALSDGSKRYQSREATVGSFALCMLFAYRELVGLTRLFEEVLWARRPGHDSLLQAVASEETEALMSWLQGRDAATLAGRLDWSVAAWRRVHVALRDQGRRPGPVAFALQRMAPHVPDAELGPLVSFALGERLRVDGLPGLVDRAVAAGSLQPYTLAEAVREGHVSLAHALAAAGARDAVIFSLAGLYRPGDATPPLAEIVRLLASTASWGRGLDDGRYDVETLLWRVDMPAAEASGLRQQLDELIERSGGDLVGFLVHASFTAASGPTDGEPAFRTWLAARIEPRLADESLQLAVVKAIDEPANFARLRPIALRLAERATARDLVQVMLSAKSESAAATIDVFHAFLATAPPSSDPDLAVVREAMARLRAIDTLGPLRSDELLDLAYAHLTR